MSVKAYQSTQIVAESDDSNRPYPIDDHGKVRFTYFSWTAAGAGDVLSTIELCRLPSGRVRILPEMSRVKCSAFGAARVLDIGHAAYNNAAGLLSEVQDVAEDTAGFGASIDISAATTVKVGSAIKHDVYSRGGVLVKAQVRGDAVPDAATLEGYIAYVYE